jgi:hypothetical protein
MLGNKEIPREKKIHAHLDEIYNKFALGVV